jgi:hypothetical protein
MATVPRTAKVKPPTLSQGTRQGQRGGTSSKEFGRFGTYGGRYVPETLMAALEELEREYERARRDKKFQARLDSLLKTYAGAHAIVFRAPPDEEIRWSEDLSEARRPAAHRRAQN